MMVVRKVYKCIKGKMKPNVKNNQKKTPFVLSRISKFNAIRQFALDLRCFCKFSILYTRRGGVSELTLPDFLPEFLPDFFP